MYKLDKFVRNSTPPTQFRRRRRRLYQILAHQLGALLLSSGPGKDRGQNVGFHLRKFMTLERQPGKIGI